MRKNSEFSSFSMDRYNKYDIPARDAVNKIFAKSKYSFVEPLNPYIVDCFMINRETGKHDFNLELEVLTKWEYKYPYPTISIGERKYSRWTTREYSLGVPSHFMLFNETLTKYCIVHNDDIIKCKEQNLIETIRVGPKDEPKKFLKIPKSLAKFKDVK